MTNEQAEQMIAIMYDQSTQLSGIGQITGLTENGVAILCILVLVSIFFAAVSSVHKDV